MERFEVAYKTQCQALHKTGIDSGTLKSTVPNSIISLSELITKAWTPLLNSTTNSAHRLSYVFFPSETSITQAAGAAGLESSPPAPPLPPYNNHPHSPLPSLIVKPTLAFLLNQAA